MPKLMSEGICMCFNKAIVQSMFKHVASENGPLVLILQSYFHFQTSKEVLWITKLYKYEKKKIAQHAVSLI